MTSLFFSFVLFEDILTYPCLGIYLFLLSNKLSTESKRKDSESDVCKTCFNHCYQSWKMAQMAVISHESGHELSCCNCVTKLFHSRLHRSRGGTMQHSYNGSITWDWLLCYKPLWKHDSDTFKNVEEYLFSYCWIFKT